MIRAILRYTQNTLVLSSALLVILALQRLHSFDSQQSHNHLNDHLSHHHDNDSGEAFDSQGPYQHVFFGREFSIGLFRFVLPRLESVEEVPPAPNMVNPRSSSMFEKEKAKVASRESSPISVAYVIAIDECSAHALDSAAILQHSISVSTKRENYQLHAFLPDNLISKCGPTLQRLGYSVVDRGGINVPKTLDEYNRDLCLSKEVMVEIYSMQLEVDLVVKAPLLSFVLPIESGVERDKSVESEGNDDKKNEYGSTTTATALVPGEKHLKILADDILRHCTMSKPSGEETRPFSQSSWSRCGSTCELLKQGTMIIDFSGCPLPWECRSRDEMTKNTSPRCSIIRDKWFQLRYGMEQALKDSIPPSDEKPAEISANGLIGRYCVKSGLGGYQYVPMLSASETQPENI